MLGPDGEVPVSLAAEAAVPTTQLSINTSSQRVGVTSAAFGSTSPRMWQAKVCIVCVCVCVRLRYCQEVCC